MMRCKIHHTNKFDVFVILYSRRIALHVTISALFFSFSYSSSKSVCVCTLLHGFVCLLHPKMEVTFSSLWHTNNVHTCRVLSHVMTTMMPMMPIHGIYCVYMSARPRYQTTIITTTKKHHFFFYCAPHINLFGCCCFSSPLSLLLQSSLWCRTIVSHFHAPIDTHQTQYTHTHRSLSPRVCTHLSPKRQYRY